MPIQFINREKELTDLETRWRNDTSEFFIIYGKRRVGKTELVKHFIQGKHTVYFLADKRAMIDQLKEIGRLFGQEFKDQVIGRQGFTNWLDVFAYIKRNVQRRFIFVVDEFPYLTEVDRATSSIFQKGWEEYLKDLNIMLILLGSSIAMMESEVLIERAPLFGRRTGQLLLKPMTFSQSWQFFPEKSFEDFLAVYTITGGMPAYLKQFDQQLSIKQNVTKRIFPTTEFLHNEIEFVLKEELREPKYYLSILRAIALNKRKLSEIVNDTGLEKPTVNKYLQTLSNLQIVERELPITEIHPEKSRKGLYRLCDNFFRFWFQYIFPFHSDLEIERTDEVLRKFREQFHILMSIAYEEVCRELVTTLQLPFSVDRVGKWWDKNEEIDLVAINNYSKDILFGECKWSEKQIGTDILEALKKKSRLVDWRKSSRNEHFILFSRSGFTSGMKELAKKEKILLVEKDKLFLN